LIDSILANRGSAGAALDLPRAGARNSAPLVNLFPRPEGIRRVRKTYPQPPIFSPPP